MIWYCLIGCVEVWTLTCKETGWGQSLSEPISAGLVRRPAQVPREGSTCREGVEVSIQYCLPIAALKLGTNVPRNERPDGSVGYSLTTLTLVTLPRLLLSTSLPYAVPPASFVSRGSARFMFGHFFLLSRFHCFGSKVVGTLTCKDLG